MKNAIRSSGVGIMAAIATVFALACATQAYADEYKTYDDGKCVWTYRLNDDGDAELYNGGKSVIPVTTAGDITVPSEIHGHRVTLIGAGAFSGCANLTGLTIPEKALFSEEVLIDGAGVFAGCTRLKKLNGAVLADIIFLAAVNDEFYGLMFSDCPKDLVLAYSVAGDGMVMHIERYGATGKAWIFVTGVEGHGAILTGLPLEDLGLGEDVASACLPVPTGVLEIPETLGGFRVTDIGEGAFANCTGITGLSIPDGVEVLPAAFYGCRGLADADGFVIINNALLGYFGAKQIVAIPNGVKTIGYGAFEENKFVRSVTIPVGVTSIGAYAFKNCTSLASVTIPSSVTSIGDGAFRGCTSLASMTIPASVTNIGNYAFENCTSLASVSIPASLTRIGEMVFHGCSESLFDSTSIPGVKIVDGWAVASDEEISGALVLSGVRGIADRAFYGCSGLTSVTLPDGVKYIGAEAFNSCDGILSLVIPGSVTSIGDYAFYDCSNLSSVSIANGVVSIGEYVFLYCESLAEITLPDSVTSLGDGAFYGCEKLKKASLPGHLRGKIDEDDVFGECPADLVVTYRDVITFDPNGGTVEETSRVVAGGEEVGELPTPVRIGPRYWTFDGWWTTKSGSSGTQVTPSTKVTAGATYYARWTRTYYSYDYNDVKFSYRLEPGSPDTAVVEYGTSEYNLDAAIATGTAGAIEIPETVDGYTVTSIGNQAFRNCEKITAVTIPSTVTNLGDCAFYRCKALAEIDIPANVKRIGRSAFYDCDELTELTIPVNVNEIGQSAFSACSKLKKVTYLGNRPTLTGDVSTYPIYDGTPDDLKSVVVEGNPSWADALASGTWQGRSIVSIPNGYEIVFDTGDPNVVQTMGSQYVEAGRVAKLDLCAYEAPRGKKFAGWRGDNGRRYDDGMLVFNLAGPGEVVTLTAVWDDE